MMGEILSSYNYVTKPESKQNKSENGPAPDISPNSNPGLQISLKISELTFNLQLLTVLQVQIILRISMKPLKSFTERKEILKVI